MHRGEPEYKKLVAGSLVLKSSAVSSNVLNKASRALAVGNLELEVQIKELVQARYAFSTAATTILGPSSSPSTCSRIVASSCQRMQQGRQNEGAGSAFSTTATAILGPSSSPSTCSRIVASSCQRMQQGRQGEGAGSAFSTTATAILGPSSSPSTYSRTFTSSG
jgi:hypothetical protein